MKTIQKILFLLTAAVVSGATLVYLSPSVYADHPGFSWSRDDGQIVITHPNYGTFTDGGSSDPNAPFRSDTTCVHSLSGFAGGWSTANLNLCGEDLGENHEVSIANSEIVQTGDDGGVEDSGEVGTEDENTEQECEAGGLMGFFSCDILKWVVDGIEWVQTEIAELLFKTEPLSLSPTDNPLYQVWSNVRDVANILLIVAFMAVIFSLALSVNVDAYAVKRMVPRLLVAAVTIQASYFIAAISVDITNVLGAGLQGLTDIFFDEVKLENAGFGGAVGGAAGSALLLYGIVAGVVAIALGAGPGGVGFFMLILLLLFLVVLGAFIIVALRDLLIMMSVVLSPIAFLANLLPATERWFKFWWSNFARLLLMYPFIILMIQMGNIGSYMVISGASSRGVLLIGIMALLMQLVAFGSIFLAFKVGGTLLSVATSGIQKYAPGGKGGKKKPGGGGGEGKGVTSRIRGHIQTGRTETAATGNWAARAAAKPSTAFGKLSDRSKAEAVGEFNRTTIEAEKDLEARGVNDTGVLTEIAEHGGSAKTFKKRIEELEGSGVAGEAEKARKLRAASHVAGKKNYQAAALKAAVSKGSGSQAAFDGVRRSLSGNPDLAATTITDAAFAAKKAGRMDLFANNNGSQSAADVVSGMSKKDWMEMSPKSLDEPQSDFSRAVHDVAHGGDSAGYRALRESMSSESGMSAAKHEKIKAAINDNDRYKQMVDEANAPRQAAGGGGGGQQTPAGGSGGGGGQQAPAGGGGGQQAPPAGGTPGGGGAQPPQEDRSPGGVILPRGVASPHTRAQRPQDPPTTPPPTPGGTGPLPPPP